MVVFVREWPVAGHPGINYVASAFVCLCSLKAHMDCLNWRNFKWLFREGANYVWCWCRPDFDALPISTDQHSGRRSSVCSLLHA